MVIFGVMRDRSVPLASLVLAALLVVAGCGGSSATPQTIYITPAPATPGPGATPTPEPSPPDISSSIISSSAPDSRWTVIFKKPVIGGVATASKMNDAITAKVNAYISAFNSGSLPAVASGMGPSTLDGNFTIATNTLSLISLRFTVLTYVSGAAHPTGLAGSINFQVSTGATIALADLFTDGATALPILTSRTHAALSSTLGTDLSWPSGSIALSFFEKAWAITSKGLEFTWSQGEIASQAAGTPSAVVSWADLKSVVKATGPAGPFVK